MIISRCSRDTIQRAAFKVGVLAQIDTLSEKRHKVRLRLDGPPERFTTTTKLQWRSSLRGDNRTRAFTAMLEIVYRHHLQLTDGLQVGDSIIAAVATDKLDLSSLPEGEKLTLIKLAKALRGKYVSVNTSKPIFRWQRSSPRHDSKRVAAVCWHGFRAFFETLYEIDSNIYARTACATYRNHEDFLAKFPQTGLRNIGSQFHPVHYAQACFCGRS